MSDRTYLEAWQQAHREAGADMDRVICERDEARAERDALAAQLEAARHAAEKLAVIRQEYAAGRVGGDDVSGTIDDLLAVLAGEESP